LKTYVPKAGDIEQKWYIVDATGKTLGRLSTEIARILRGKHKPMFTPFLDTGDHVIVINAKDIVLTGRKLEQKNHYRHSGYPGGLKTVPYSKLMETHPERAIEYAVKGMLPHNRLGRKVFRKLKVYAGDKHPHESQQPEALSL
jgi:large subunit ribosomal protein L13